MKMRLSLLLFAVLFSYATVAREQRGMSAFERHKLSLEQGQGVRETTVSQSNRTDDVSVKNDTEKTLPAYRYDSIIGYDTTLTNLKTLNSSQNDYEPFLLRGLYDSGEQDLMLFSSDRYRIPETKTEEYTEKAYYSKGRDEIWETPVQNGYKWNSDNNTSLVGYDEDNLYFYRHYWPRDGVLFYAQRKDNEKRPYSAGRLRRVRYIQSDSDEVAITTIGPDSVVFVSNRRGDYDIYLCTGKDEITALDNLNTAYEENDVYYDRHSSTLYFSSNRPDGFGGFDIYRSSHMGGGRFSTPEILTDTFVNKTSSDERDFHRDDDSTMVFASNRNGGVGNLDLYLLRIRPIYATIEKDSVPVDTVIETPSESKRDELTAMLDSLGLLPFHGEVQIGAYRYIKSLEDFYKRFPCITSEDIKMQKITVDDTILVHKYIINKVYTDVDEALDKQFQIERMHCLPDKVFADMPFIGCLDKNGNRFAIFWKKDELAGQKIFYIRKNGKLIWKTRKF